MSVKLTSTIVGVNDESQIPYNEFRRISNNDGSVSWKRNPKSSLPIIYIEKITKMTLEEAKSLPTEDKYFWLWLMIDKDRREAGRGNEIFSNAPILLLIEREHFFRDSFEQFRTTTNLDLRQDIRIHFLNEVSQDAGGLLREWFSILIEELFNPKQNLFTRTNTKKVMYLPNENSDKLIENYLDYYYYCGQITAKALYERIPIKAYFSKIIFKKLLDEEVTIEDMKYCDLELYESMQYILNSQITKGDSLSNFTCTKKDPISGKIITIELKENGANIQVDDSNKVEFVNLLFNELFIKNTKLQIEEIISGFISLLPKSMITVLDSDELELFICGEVTIDVDGEPKIEKILPSLIVDKEIHNEKEKYGNLENDLKLEFAPAINSKKEIVIFDKIKENTMELNEIGSNAEEEKKLILNYEHFKKPKKESKKISLVNFYIL